MTSDLIRAGVARVDRRAALLLGAVGMVALLSAATVGAGNSALMSADDGFLAHSGVGSPPPDLSDKPSAYPSGGDDALAALGSAMDELALATDWSRALAALWGGEWPDAPTRGTVFVIAAYAVTEIRVVPPPDVLQ